MVSVNGPGHTMSRHPFFLDPREGLLEPNAYDQLSLVAECTAFPIGVLYGDRASIAGDDRGRVLLIESYGEALAGIDIHDALNRLIIGIRPEPF